MGTRVVHPVLGRGTLVSSKGEGIAVLYDGGALIEYPGQSIGSSEHRRLLDHLDFCAALSALKSSQCVARSGWNGKGMFIFLITEWTYTNGRWDNYPNLPFIAMKTVDGSVVPWFASQTDILAEDWEIVDNDG